MRLLRPLLAVALAGCAPAAATIAPPAPARVRVAALDALVDSLVAEPIWRSAHWGILIVDPTTGDTLHARNAGKLFMPASNQKLLTGAVALARLGPGYTFATTFHGVGPDGGPAAIADGVLQGDLVVVGTGDPTVSDHARGDAMQPLLAVADSLRARGITGVAGVVRPAGDALPGSPLGFGWAWDDLDYAYSAGVDELYFNEGFTNVVVHGGARAGGPVRVRTTPTRTSPPVVVRATTDTAGARSTLELARGALGERLTLTGAIATGDSAVLRMTHRDPRGAYLAALQEALAARGITVANAVVGGPAEPAAAGAPLFTTRSLPLREILPLLQKPSQNQIAELLFRTLGREVTGVGTPDSGRAVVERQLAAWGAQPDGFAVRDGSGLSRHNYVTPETVVRVLAAMQRDTTYGTFYHALPVAGVDGTIASRMRGTPAQANVHAKTGYIDKARALSGYVTTADSVTLLFSLLANNFTTSTREVERVQDAIAAHLAGMRLRAAATARRE